MSGNRPKKKKEGDKNMSKPVRLDVNTYKRLETFRRKRETMTQAVDRLLNMKDAISDMIDTLNNSPVKTNILDREVIETNKIKGGN